MKNNLKSEEVKKICTFGYGLQCNNSDGANLTSRFVHNRNEIQTCDVLYYLDGKHELYTYSKHETHNGTLNPKENWM